MYCSLVQWCSILDCTAMQCIAVQYRNYWNKLKTWTLFKTNRNKSQVLWKEEEREKYVLCFYLNTYLNCFIIQMVCNYFDKNHRTVFYFFLIPLFPYINIRPKQWLKILPVMNYCYNTYIPAYSWNTDYLWTF